MSDVRPDPPNIPGEDEPPDIQLAVLVVILLLRDLRDHLDPAYEDEHDRADLLLRVLAVLAVMKRVSDRLEEDAS